MKSCLFLVMVLLSVSSIYAEWQTEMIMEGPWWDCISIELGWRALPHIAFSSDPTVWYVHNDSLQWVIDTVSTNGYGPSLGLSGNDNPLMSIFEGSELMYGGWVGSSWYFSMVDTIGQYNSMKLDIYFHPRISYYDPDNENLKFASYSSAGGWSVQVIDSTGNVGLYTSLELDSSDTPHIVYYDGTNESLKHAFWNQGSWLTETICDPGNGTPLWNSLAIDSEDRLHVAFCVSSIPYDSDLYYAYENGSVWEIEVVDSEGATGKYCSIALDSDEQPCICYRDDDTHTLEFARRSGTVWQIETVSDFDGAHTAMEISSHNIAHIAYGDSDGLMHAWQVETGIGVGESVGPMVLSPNPASGSFHLDFSVPAGGNADVLLYDVTGRLAYRAFEGPLQEGNNSIDIDCSHLPVGVYVVQVSTGTGSSARKILLVQ